MRYGVLIFIIVLSTHLGFSQSEKAKELPNAEISFVTSKGKQSWAVGDGRFSIAKVGEGYCMNLWIMSNDSLTTKSIDPEMDSSYGPVIECSIWEADYPNNLVGTEFVVPNYNDNNSDKYGSKDYASSNMYYYEHHSLENIKVKVVREVSKNVYELNWISDCEDVFDWEGPMMKVKATIQLELTDTLKGYWLD